MSKLLVLNASTPPGPSPHPGISRELRQYWIPRIVRSYGEFQTISLLAGLAVHSEMYDFETETCTVINRSAIVHATTTSLVRSYCSAVEVVFVAVDFSRR